MAAAPVGRARPRATRPGLPAQADERPGPSPRQRVWAIVAGASGNLVEWYDFYAYSFFALYFAPLFFPSGDATAQLLKTAGIFAAGFLMRPLGSWYFGRHADRVGRRSAMVRSVLLMCAGSLLIAVTPGHAALGGGAAVLLLLGRLLQGFSVGGEYGTSATYMSEVAIARHRGFMASFQYVTLIGGQLLAVLTLVLLQQLLSPAQLGAWGWRIPFVVGAGLAVVALYLRRALPETAPAEPDAGAGTLRALRPHARALALVLALTAGGSLAFYTYTTYMQKYLVNTAGMAVETASLVMTLALLVFMLLQPLFGALADVIGRRASLRLFGVLTTVSTVPLLAAIAATTDPRVAFGLILMALISISFYTAISGLVKAELFPAPVRALGVGLSYAVANAVFGGSAEYVALWFKAAGSESWFYWYVTAFAGVALAAAVLMPDSRRGSHLDHS